MDEDQNSVEEEVTPQDQDQAIETPEDAQEDAQEKNWRELRKKAEEAEKQTRDYQQKLLAQEEMIKNLMELQKAQKPEVPKEVDEFADVDPNDFPTWQQADKRIEKRAEQIAERKYQELEAKREQSRFKERLESKFNDFDDVVNPQTIATFEKEQPELAQTIAELKDPYKMGLQTYTFIKSMGIVGNTDKSRHAKEVDEKLKKGEQAIQSPQAYNKRPMAQAFSMANMGKEEKVKLYEEMLGYASRAPGY